MGRVITTNLKKSAVQGMRKTRVGKSSDRVSQQRGARMAGARQASTIQAVVASEKRGCDWTLNVGTSGGIVDTTNTNADFVCVNCVQEGPASHNRIGRKIFMKSLRIKGFARMAITPSSGSYRHPQLRQVVIYDKSPTGTMPTWNTIFGVTDDAGAETCPNVLCPPRYDNMQRFTLLSDQVIDFSDVAPFTSGVTTWIEQAFDHYIPLKNLEATFKSTTNPGVVGDLATGALYIAYRTTSTVGSLGAEIQTLAIARLRYY